MRAAIAAAALALMLFAAPALEMTDPDEDIRAAVAALKDPLEVNVVADAAPAR